MQRRRYRLHLIKKSEDYETLGFKDVYYKRMVDVNDDRHFIKAKSIVKQRQPYSSVVMGNSYNLRMKNLPKNLKQRIIDFLPSLVKSRSRYRQRPRSNKVRDSKRYYKNVIVENDKDMYYKRRVDADDNKHFIKAKSIVKERQPYSNVVIGNNYILGMKNLPRRLRQRVIDFLPPPPLVNIKQQHRLVNNSRHRLRPRTHSNNEVEKRLKYYRSLVKKGNYVDKKKIIEEEDLYTKRPPIYKNYDPVNYYRNDDNEGNGDDDDDFDLDLDGELIGEE